MRYRYLMITLIGGLIMNANLAATTEGLSIYHRVGFKAPLEKVYEALTTIKGFTGWWTQTVNGEVEPGARLDFVFPLATLSMRVLEQSRNERVVWENIGGPPPWLGTKITFNLKREDDFTIIMFSHTGWKNQDLERMAHSSTKWAYFLLSLKSLIEDGKGTPAPYDRKVDNWN